MTTITANDSDVRFFCGRLFIVSGRPIEELHEIARQLRIPARMFDNSRPYMPNYRVSHRKFREAQGRFGACWLAGDIVQRMLEECYRPDLDAEALAEEAECREVLAKIDGMAEEIRRINQMLVLTISIPEGSA